jgi:cell fate regulator YaaT (PSP1 superfamily)
MDLNEYLVTYGCAGELGRFRSTAPLELRRGDRVVVRTPRGLELGDVLCLSTPRHARALEHAVIGELLRQATAEDESIAAGAAERAQRLFEDGRRLTAEQNLPLEILDVEVLLDAHHVTLYFVRLAPCDERPLVRALSKKYEAMVAMHDLALPAGASACGRPDCKNDGGGCTTCSTGGGCSTCGKTMSKDVQEYFAGLRKKMEEQRRVSLA